MAALAAAALSNAALSNAASNESSHDRMVMPSADTGGNENITTCYVCHRCMGRAGPGSPSAWDPHAGSAGDGCSAWRRGGNVSLMCLSCHDGAVAPIPPTSENWFAGQRTLGVSGSGRSREIVIGHHPYWVSYPLAGNGDFLARAGQQGCSLPLFSPQGGRGPRDRVECPTCHDIHSRPGESYLRAPKEDFELCLCCHRELPPLSSEVFLPMQKEQEVIESGECRSCHNM